MRVRPAVQAARPRTRNSRAERDPALSSRHDAPTPDRRLRWRRVLDGGGNPLLDDYVLGLAAAAGRERPKVCFLPTASGDADHYVVRFYRHFAGEPLRAVAHLAVPARLRHRRRARPPARPGPRVRRRRQRHLPAGRPARARARRRAARGWESGVVLCGLSAGSLCWFAEAMTGFHGASRPVQGIGPPPGVQRRPLRQGGAPPPRLPRRRRRRHARRLRGGGRRGAALRRRDARARRVLAGRRRARTG